MKIFKSDFYSKRITAIYHLPQNFQSRISRIIKNWKKNCYLSYNFSKNKQKIRGVHLISDIGFFDVYVELFFYLYILSTLEYTMKNTMIEFFSSYNLN